MEAQHDKLARLTAATYYPGLQTSGVRLHHFSYGYDLAGNRTSKGYTSDYPVVQMPVLTNYSYDAANRLVTDSAGHTYTYDAAGRITSDGVNSYTWDRANRLLSMGGSQYAYNGLGQRVSQTVAGQVTRYLLDVQPGLWQVLASTTGTDTTRFVHGPTGMQQQQNANAAWLHPLQDALGFTGEDGS